jgi:Flp pilus assembly protein CpaB
MWKVKRMNIARIVVLTIAVGAGGVAAYLASGSDNKPSTAPKLVKANGSGFMAAILPTGMRAISTEISPETEDLVRNGVSSLTTTQK